MSQTLFPSEADLQLDSRGANRSRRVTVDDALASFGSEGEPTADASETGTAARSGVRLPPIERKILGTEVVLPADPPMAPVEPRRPRLLVMLQIAAAVALGALLGLSYVRYRLPSSPATTSVVEIEPPATNPAASRESTPSTPAAGVEATSVRRVLNAYAHAYDRLDALAASALWPGVDRPALSRVFDSVSSQRVTLTRCDITISGERATAQCAGVIEFIPRVGDPSPQSRNIDWTFDLNRSSGQWGISALTTKYPSLSPEP